MANAFAIEDLRSGNGTHVNGSAITRRPITTGDQIRIGDYTLSLIPYDRMGTGGVVADVVMAAEVVEAEVVEAEVVEAQIVHGQDALEQEAASMTMIMDGKNLRDFSGPDDDVDD